MNLFSKEFRMIGGGFLLALGYSPLLLNSFYQKDVACESKEEVSLSLYDEFFFNKPILESKLTDGLRNQYLLSMSQKDEIEKNFDVKVT